MLPGECGRGKSRVDEELCVSNRKTHTQVLASHWYVAAPHITGVLMGLLDFDMYVMVNVMVNAMINAMVKACWKSGFLVDMMV